MPYVTQARRDALSLLCKPAENAGELNFQITQLLIRYIHENGLRYEKINDCIGACHAASAEFYRRMAAPYEDYKIGQNGDVYPEPLDLGRLRQGSRAEREQRES